MTPEIVSRGEFTVVGVRTVMEMSTTDTGTLWKDKFLPRRNEVPATGPEYYGVFNILPTEEEAGKFEYVAGVLGSLENIPVGMVGWVIPDGTYAVAQAVGITSIARVCRDVITDWLPDSGYVMVQSPMFAVTVDPYPDAPEAEWTVSIPVETPETIARLEQWLKAAP